VILTGEIVALRDAYAFAALFLDRGTRSKRTKHESLNVLFENFALDFQKKAFLLRK